MPFHIHSAIMKKTDSNLFGGSWGGILEAYALLVGMENGTATVQNVWAVLQKLKWNYPIA